MSMIHILIAVMTWLGYPSLDVTARPVDAYIGANGSKRIVWEVKNFYTSVEVDCERQDLLAVESGGRVTCLVTITDDNGYTNTGPLAWPGIGQPESYDEVRRILEMVGQSRDTYKCPYSGARKIVFATPVAKSVK